MSVKQVGILFREAAKKFQADNCGRLGAAMSFYTALSLSPLLLAVIALAGLVLGEEAARGEIVNQLKNTIGTEAAVVIEQLVQKSSDPGSGWVAGAIALATLFYGASGVFAELQSSLNTIWKVPGLERTSGWVVYLKDRLLSFSLVGGTAFLLLVSLVVSAVLNGVATWIESQLPGLGTLAMVVNFVVSFALTTALFAMIFNWLPDTDLAWSDVWVGAVVTSGLFAIGKFGIGLYLGQAAVGSAYGAAGAFVVLLVWLYYSSQIVLFGAELTYVYADRFGHGVGDARRKAPAAGTGQQKVEASLPV